MIEDNKRSNFQHNFSEKILPSPHRFNFPSGIQNKSYSNSKYESMKHLEKEKLKLPKISEIRKNSQNVERNSTQPEYVPTQFLNQDKLIKKKNKSTTELIQLNQMAKYSNDFAYDSDDFDFEEKVNRNREIIKKNKQNYQQYYKNPHSLIEKRQLQFLNSLKKINRKKQSLFQKKNKQYPTISEKNIFKQQVEKQIFSKQLIPKPQQKKSHQNKIQKDNSNSSANSLKKISFKRVESNKSLLNGIQDYLSKSNLKSNTQKSLAIRQISKEGKKRFSDQIKIIDKKLKFCRKEEKFENLGIQINQSKNEIMDNFFKFSETSFQRQQEKLKKLWERNKNSIEEFLDNGKFLIDLTIGKKAINKRIQQK